MLEQVKNGGIVDDITKMELNVVNAMRQCAGTLQHEVSFGNTLGVAQIALLALILWRVW